MKLLYESILDTELKRYSGLDDKTLELLDSISTISISESNLEFKTLHFVFLPDELQAAENVIQQVKENAKNADSTWLAKMSQYDEWLDAQENVTSSYSIKNVATAVDLILKLFTKNICQLQEAYEKPEDDKNWIPLETVTGRRKIPAKSAKTIAKALNKLQGKENIKSSELWRGLEILAENYLNGAEN